MGKDLVAGALAFLVLLCGEARAQMHNTTPQDLKIPSIQVTGQGTVQAQPDIAVINIGVTTEDGNAQSAVSRNTAATAKVIAELEAASIERKDLRTSNFSVYPQIRTEGETKRQVTVYRVSNTVTVTIRDLAKIGDILTKAVSAGSNQINGPSFSVSSPEKYLNEARKRAVDDAMSKAAAYANAAGLKLGSVLAMVEEGGASQIYATRSAGALMKSAVPVPVEAGEESLQAQITVVVELKQ